jgi:predicted phage baseplate assembly protein
MLNLNSDRGRIQPPNLDDRTWQDLVDEAVALIPRYAPQWTDYSPGDLGRTLIELFAWLVEGLTYRLNRVPDKNYIAFLNLLGITREPAIPAEVFLTFTAPPPADGQVPTPIRVPKGTQARTQGTESEAPIIFETDAEANVLPINLKTVLQVTVGTAQNPGRYTNITSFLAAPPDTGYTLTLTGAPMIQGGQPAQPAQPMQLFIGFDQQVAATIQLSFELFNPIQVDPVAGKLVNVTWSYSTGTDPTTWSSLPTSNIVDGTNGLQQNGVVAITLPTNLPAKWTSQAPPSWTSVAPVNSDNQVKDNLFWIGLTLTNLIAPTTTAAAPSVQIGFNYIFLLSNSVLAHNALTISPAPAIPSAPEGVGLGTSNGRPSQVFTLKNRPLFKRPGTDSPYDHLVIQVDGIPWTQVDDFPAGGDTVYRLDPVIGQITFGDFDPQSNQQGHGLIPHKDAQITATKYRYVAGGLAGNVGSGKINALLSTVNDIISVINIMSASGGADEEAIEDTLRRAPERLRRRDRAITMEDYEALAREASDDVVIVKCLDPRIQDVNTVTTPTKPGAPWTYGGLDRSPGNVNVIIVPDKGPNVARPQPDNDTLYTVKGYLEKRCDLTAHLLVKGPRYLPIIVSVNLVVWKSMANPTVLTTIQGATLDKIMQFLHPTRGGLDGTGWQVGQSVFVTDLFKAIQPSPDIGYISTLAVWADIPDYHFPPIGTGTGGDWDSKQPTERPYPIPKAPGGASVRLADYELVCAANRSSHSVPPPTFEV